ncbi:MAG: type II toxin-antitoxin system RelE/ParE family toxin, partial [Rhodospirillaceae bacterium]
MGDPQYLVRIRSEALADLDREYAYSKRQWGVEHARSYFATLRARIANLAKHPMQSPGIGGRNSEWR